MVKPISTEAIEKNTDKSWGEWVDFINAFGGKDKSHKQIAQFLIAQGVDGWWAQSITVAYEQYIGRRAPGQSSDGSFTANVSKTLAGSMDEAMSAWQALVNGIAEFDGVGLDGEPSLNKTEKWHNWRCKLKNGSRVIVGITQKSADKALIGLAHEKLSAADDIERWKKYWKEQLDSLA